jgi:predicted TIM-barrel fold metal-dependent hydrolase
VIDPRRSETYVQAEAMLAQPQCAGIKIHPEEHGYPIREHAQAIFEFAARHKAVVLTHSSEQNSQAADFIPWADAFPEMRLILAHIGCGWDGDLTHQVRAIQQSRHGNVYADTSSVRSCRASSSGRCVRSTRRVLFGTDTPRHRHAADADRAGRRPDDWRLILRDSAVRLFRLSI